VEKYIQTKNQQLIFSSGIKDYPYLLEVTEFVKNSDNPNNYNGQRQFRLLDKKFIATGDGFSLSCLPKYCPDCEILEDLKNEAELNALENQVAEC